MRPVGCANSIVAAQRRLSPNWTGLRTLRPCRLRSGPVRQDDGRGGGRYVAKPYPGRIAVFRGPGYVTPTRSGSAWPPGASIGTTSSRTRITTSSTRASSCSELAWTRRSALPAATDDEVDPRAARDDPPGPAALGDDGAFLPLAGERVADLPGAAMT